LTALEADPPADRLHAVLEAEQAGAPGGICAADTVVADGDTRTRSRTSTSTCTRDARECLAAFVNVSETT
jgi:hypothetical protein